MKSKSNIHQYTSKLFNIYKFLMMFARTISFRIKLNIDVLSAISYFPEKSPKEWLAKKMDWSAANYI